METLINAVKTVAHALHDTTASPQQQDQSHQDESKSQTSQPTPQPRSPEHPTHIDLSQTRDTAAAGSGAAP
ncbi:hypothetical protein HK097_002206, partial [Rhizophlyctis rosea]